MRLEIGTKLMLMPFVCLDKRGNTSTKPIEGTVVYINKPHRYFTAEFVFPKGSFREAFKFHYKSDLMPKKKTGGGAFCNCEKKFFI
jgi:hypothetical protein